jgi:hypothetical protein
MGEGVYGRIVKGPIHQKVDAVINERNAAGQYHRRAQFLADVVAAATADDYLDLIMSQAGVTPEESTYLRTTWYNEGVSGLWPWLQPIYPILQRGLIKAIEVAQQAPALPIDSYWSPASTQVEVLVTRSPQQVTRLILTPATMAPTRNRPHPAPLWVIRRGSAQTQVGDFTNDEIVEAVHGNVITWQAKDF